MRSGPSAAPPNRAGRWARGWQSAMDPSPPSIPMASAIHAPTSITERPRAPAMTTARHEPRSGRLPGGQDGGRVHTPAVRRLPRGHVASGDAHDTCSFSRIGSSCSPQPASPDTLSHVPEATSSRWPVEHVRKEQPSGPKRAAAPQKASPKAGGTQAPMRTTLSCVQTQRLSTPRSASRGHMAAARSGPSPCQARAHPATLAAAIAVPA